MENELNEVIELIEEYLKQYVWDSKPPMNDLDYQLIVLGVNIAKLKRRLDVVKEPDWTISQFMHFMELAFHIPLFEKHLEEWLNEDPIRNKLVLTIYRKLSALRRF